MFSVKNWIRRAALAKQLKSVEPADREDAVEQLAEMADPANVAAFALALKDPEARVRKAAARALLHIDDPAAVTPLTEALSDTASTGAWQSDVIAALEQFREKRSVSACINALNSSEVKVRRSAANALGTLGDAWAVVPLLKAILDADAETSRNAGYALAKIGQPALKGLVQILQDAPAQARISAAEALGVIGDSAAIPAMVTALKDPDSYLQIAVAKALARIKDPAVVQVLIDALEESASAAFYYGVRDEAGTALIKMGTTVIEPLLESLKNASTRGRLFIIYLLGEISDPRSFLPLVELLKDSHSDVRKAAFAVLLKVDGKRAIEVLPPLLDDPDYGLRLHAAEALHRANWPAESPRDRARLAIALGRYQQALNEGDEAIPLLLGRLQDAESAVRREVVNALGGLKDKRFLPSFQMAAANEQEVGVLQLLVGTMEAYGSVAVEPLVVLLESGGWGLRRHVTRSLMRLGWQPQTERQSILRALATGDVDGLVAAGERALDSITQAVTDSDREVQETATAALQKLEAIRGPSPQH